MKKKVKCIVILEVSVFPDSEYSNPRDWDWNAMWEDATEQGDWLKKEGESAVVIPPPIGLAEVLG